MQTPLVEPRSRRLAGLGARAVAAVLTGSVALTASLALAGPTSATAADEPSAEPLVTPRGPLTTRPVAPGSIRRTWTFPERPGRGIHIGAKCGTPVVAVHPGIAKVASRPAWGNKVRVRIVSSPGQIVTIHRFLRKAEVTGGQLIQAGQQIGEVPWHPEARKCRTTFRVRSNGRMQDPTSWLDAHVGRVAPTDGLLGDPGFMLASFNVLGASHTAPGGSRAAWPDYHKRLPRAIEMLERYGADVVGLQEFQRKQRALFLELTGDSWGVYPESATADPENSIIYRKSRFELVSGATFAVPYFNGHVRQMPYVLLRDLVTGRTAYVINVHNPATTKKYPSQERHRSEAIRQERQLVIDLRAQGRPVFLTGDFNDRAQAFCPLTAGKLMISPESIPSMTCAMPKYFWVDWIFAAGQTRFSSLSVDTSPKPKRITDHPLVIGRAHLAD